MAKQGIGVSLGFVDEMISDKYKDQLNFTINKIGGLPDFPSDIKFDLPKCPLCHLVRPLVVQIYAPLENSPYHRTLHLFACINPNCWSSSESWICLRVQTEEQITNTTKDITKISVNDWCAEADDWNDCSEENGNIIDNLQSNQEGANNLVENLVHSKLESMNIDDNKNDSTEFQGGAVGRLYSPVATAEIEGNEGEVISIDTPTFPQCNVMALMQEVNSVPQELFEMISRNRFTPQFEPYFISVWEETVGDYSTSTSDSHVKELLQDYQQKNTTVCTNLSSENGSETQESSNFEKYEKSLPAHGDKMFHRFLSRLQSSPGQILRYDRETAPLLPYQLSEVAKKCQHCQGDTVFEFQLVPTIISKLKFSMDTKFCERLEFCTVLVYTCRKSCFSAETCLYTENVILLKEKY